MSIKACAINEELEPLSFTNKHGGGLLCRQHGDNALISSDGYYDGTGDFTLNKDQTRQLGLYLIRMSKCLKN